MHMLTHRLQILLDEGRYGRLAHEASRRRVSVAAVIRGAIDEALPPAQLEKRRAAVAAVLAAEAMPVPREAVDLRRELDEARRARG